MHKSDRRSAGVEIETLLHKAEELIGAQYKKEKEDFAKMCETEQTFGKKGIEASNAIKYLREASSKVQTARYRSDDALFFDADV